MIDIQCSGCGKRYKVPEAFAGKKTRCKQCSAVIAIPLLPTPNEPPVPEAIEPAAEEARIAAGGPISAPEPAAPAPPLPRTPGGRKPLKMPARQLPPGAKKPGLAARAPAGAAVPLHARKHPPKPGAKPSRRDAGEGGEVHEAGAGSGGSKSKTLVAVGLLAVLLLGGGAAYYFLDMAGAEKADTKAAASKKPKASKTESDVVAGKALSGKDAAAAKATADPTAVPEAAEVAQPVEALAVIPRDVSVVGQIAFGRLLNIPGIRDQVEAQSQSEDVKGLFEEAGFDPSAHVARIWFAADFSKVDPSGAAFDPETLSGVALVEGTFDREKLLAGLKKRSLLSPQPKMAGAIEVYTTLEEDSKDRRLAFLSDEQALYGQGDVFDKAVQLAGGKGESVRANPALKEVSKDFSGTGLLWAAIDLPESFRDAAKTKAGGGPPRPNVDGAFLSIDSTGDGAGVAIEAAVHCPTPEDIKTAQGFIGPMISMARTQTPPELKPLFEKIKIVPQGKVLQLKLEIPGEVLEKLKAGAVPVPTGDEEETEPEAEDTGEKDAAKPGKAEMPEEAAEEPALDEAKTEPAEEPTPDEADTKPAEEPAP